MAKQEKINLEDIDFTKVKGDDVLMNIFIEFAESHPKQGSKLFNKYVDFLCKEYSMTKEAAKKFAVTNIGYMTGYYAQSTAKLLFSVYKQISHPLFGRER